ncbi:unnamed protein product [Echinostoma caproni]|uniref:RMI1_C domain-containing protein n=1 Tax=Echinostoma caproni TaxID=27848 RepID=A0A183ABL3_9TREM|nr:unnamed protein product [Echinostoma caproni]
MIKLRTESSHEDEKAESCVYSLSVVGLYNVGESYYSQLRQHEGNISVNLPYLDNLEADLGHDLDHTHMTQAFSQFVGAGTQRAPAIEFGTLSSRSGQRMLSPTELAGRLKPGVKVRLRGPLLLRNKVLILPAGALQTLSHPQFQVLGGEVDELLESPDGDVIYQLGVLLAKKMDIAIGEDGALPSWFPRVSAPARALEPHDNIVVSDSMNKSSGVHQPPPTASESPVMEPWGDDGFDDAMLNQAAQNLEENLTRPALDCMNISASPRSTNTLVRNTFSPTVSTAVDEFDRSLEDEVDPDVFAEAMHELDSTLANPPKKTIALVEVDKPERDDNPACTSRPLFFDSKSETDVKPTPKLTSSSNAKESDDLLPPAPKRKPWERKTPNPSRKMIPGTSSASLKPDLFQEPLQIIPAKDLKFHPFCYIDDMYEELLRASSNSSAPPRKVYTIRGLLITLLSPLEHHQGTRWTLAARLADGSAVVDVNISSDLLTEWIGLTAAESESLCQLSRALTTGSGTGTNPVAIQEAQKHRARLRTALVNCQSRLSNLAGLFDLTPPPLVRTSLCQSDAESSDQDRPILVAFRDLDGNWLRELHDRVQSRGTFGTRSDTTNS